MLRKTFACAAAAVVAGCGGGADHVSRPSVGGRTVLLAAGDIAECGAQGDEATAKILGAYPTATIATPTPTHFPVGKFLPARSTR